MKCLILGILTLVSGLEASLGPEPDNRPLAIPLAVVSGMEYYYLDGDSDDTPHQIPSVVREDITEAELLSLTGCFEVLNLNGHTQSDSKTGSTTPTPQATPLLTPRPRTAPPPSSGVTFRIHPAAFEVVYCDEQAEAQNQVQAMALVDPVEGPSEGFTGDPTEEAFVREQSPSPQASALEKRGRIRRRKDFEGCYGRDEDPENSFYRSPLKRKRKLPLTRTPHPRDGRRGGTLTKEEVLNALAVRFPHLPTS